MSDVDRQKLKDSISLREIQERYFEIVERNFNHLIPSEMNPVEAGLFVQNNYEAKEKVKKIMPDFLLSMTEFWNGMIEPATIHIQDLQSLKAAHGGGLSPSATGNIVSTFGLYTETIVLVEPFTFIAFSQQLVESVDIVRILIETAANILRYKDLALENLDIPIVVVLPNKIAFDKNELNILRNSSVVYSLRHASRLFGKQFSDIDELREFTISLDNPEKVSKSIKDTSLIDIGGESSKPLSPQEQIEFMFPNNQYGKQIGLRFVSALCEGGMMQTIEMSRRCELIGASPLIDLPFAWKSFNWKCEYDASFFPEIAPADLHINRALQSADSRKDMQWLGNIPPNVLVKMRKEGADAEIRGALAKGVKELAAADPKDFSSTSDQVFNNVQSLFNEHDRKIQKLVDNEEQLIKSCLIKGGISLALYCTFGLTEAIVSFAASELGNVPKFKDIYKLYKETREEGKKLMRSPMALFFEHRPMEKE